MRRRRPISARMRTGALGAAACAAALVGFTVGRHPARWIPIAGEVAAISVVGARGVDAFEVVTAAGLAGGTPLADVNTAELAASVQRHPQIARARVRALAPSRLLVAIVEREPAAVALVDASSAWWVDAEGTPYAPAGGPVETELPRIVGAGEIEVSRPDPLLAQAVAIARAVERSGLTRPRFVHVGGAERRALPAIELPRPPARVLLGGGGIEAKLGRLARLLAADLPEARTASVIDLRFGNRIVLRSSSADGEPEPARADASAPANGPAR